jgi:hypothetical protein
MKLLLSAALLLFSFAVDAQASSLVTMAGMGDIKLGMKKAEFEKLLNQKFTLPHLTANDDDYYQDTVHIIYKGLEADVIFQKEYSENDKFDISVSEIRSSSPQLKTKSGIGIGDDKFRIISTYEGYLIWIMPEYENNDAIKSKTRSSVWLHGDSGNVIVFYLTSNKVTSMSVLYYEGD